MANIEIDGHLSLELNDLKNAMIELKDRSQVDSNHTEYVVGGTIAAGGSNDEQLVLRRIIMDKATTPPAPNKLPASYPGKPDNCLTYRAEDGWHYIWHYMLNELNLPNASVDFNSQKAIRVANGTNATDAVNYGQLLAAMVGLLPQTYVLARVTDSDDLVTKSDGQRWLIDGTGANDFEGQDNKVATWNSGTSTWTFETPAAGWILMSYEYPDPDVQTSPNPQLYGYNATSDAWVLLYTGLTYIAGNCIDIALGGIINVLLDEISITAAAAGIQNGDPFQEGDKNVGEIKIKLPNSGVLSSNAGDGGVVLNYDANTLEAYAGTSPDTKNYLAVKAAGVIEAGAGLTSSVTNRKTTINAVATDESILVGADSFGVQFGGALKTLKLNGGANVGVEVKLDPLTMEVTANGVSAKNPRLFFIDTTARTHTAQTGEVVYTVTHGLLTRQVKVTVYKLDSGGDIVGVIYPRININGTNTVQVCITNQLSTFDFKVAVEA